MKLFLTIAAPDRLNLARKCAGQNQRALLQPIQGLADLAQ